MGHSPARSHATPSRPLHLLFLCPERLPRFLCDSFLHSFQFPAHMSSRISLMILYKNSISLQIQHLHSHPSLFCVFSYHHLTHFMLRGFLYHYQYHTMRIVILDTLFRLFPKTQKYAWQIKRNQTVIVE